MKRWNIMPTVKRLSRSFLILAGGLLDLKNGTVRNLTAHMAHKGFLRYSICVTAVMSCSARIGPAGRARETRDARIELWWMDAQAARPAVRLGATVFEGIATSSRSNLVAWAENSDEAGTNQRLCSHHRDDGRIRRRGRTRPTGWRTSRSDSRGCPRLSLDETIAAQIGSADVIDARGGGRHRPDRDSGCLVMTRSRSSDQLPETCGSSAWTVCPTSDLKSQRLLHSQLEVRDRVGTAGHVESRTNTTACTASDHRGNAFDGVRLRDRAAKISTLSRSVPSPLVPRAAS